MKTKIVRKWSKMPQKEKDKVEHIVTLILAALLFGCYVYIGYLVTLL